MEKPIYEIWGSELFDKIWSSTSFNDEQVRLISEALASCSKVLDLGTGIGNVANRLVQTGKTVYGVDTSQRNLDYASRKIKSPLFHPVIKDVQMLDYREEFDGASCASNMAYFSDLKRTVSGVYRALKPKTLFAVTGYEADKMQEWARLTGEESGRAIQSGKISLSEEELRALPQAQEATLETIDSSQRTRSALEKEGFRILRDEKFYHDTCYFILVEKV